MKSRKIRRQGIQKQGVQKKGQLFGKMDIIRHFFDEPEKEFHMREIARLAGMSPSTASKRLSTLARDGLLTSAETKGMKIFKANSRNPSFRDAKLFYNISRIRSSGLVDYISEELNPKAIILFGSFRKGDNVPGSDIDIFVETASKKDIDLSDFERRLGNSIQLFLMKSSEIASMKKNNKELLNNIANGISLEGFLEVIK